MVAFLLTLAGFLLGSIPFSVWLGRIFLGTDIRQYGDDRNPGSVNAWRAGSWKVGFPALLLDFVKGLLPVGLGVYYFNLSGWPLVPVALAPICGHAFSPLLRFKGGKAIAVTFGVWTALFPPAGPIILGVTTAILIVLLSSRAWALMLGMAVLMAALLFTRAPLPFLAIWLGNQLLLLWKHLPEIREGLALNPRLLNHSESP